MKKPTSIRIPFFALASVVVLGAGCLGAPEPAAEHDAVGAGALGGPVCLGAESGAYCGNDTMSGAAAGTLYQCPGANLAPTSSQVCSYGCVVAPPGQPDRCATGPTCLGSAAGAYCGNDMMSGGAAATLYQCPGANLAPTSSQVCANGCLVAPPGTPDTCQAAAGGGTADGGTGDGGMGDGGTGGASPNSYKLPWRPGVAMWLTQDCNDSCCNDHVGNDAYAWDFADYTAFDVLAARGGTVTHLKIDSTNGCGSSSCQNLANYIVIDHGDGTQSTYLHLQGMSLDPAVTCGAAVVQGQHLATAGSTGWSSGTHLHFQVSPVHPGAPTCECGPTGMGCSSSSVPWADFWSTPGYATVPVSFVEWPAASQCANRRIALPASTN